MTNIRIKLPQFTINLIAEEARIQGTTRRNLIESYLRKGMAIYLKLEECLKSNDNAGAQICQKTINTIIIDIGTSKGSFYFETKTMQGADMRQRLDEVSAAIHGINKHRTTVTVNDAVADFLIEVSDFLDRPLSLVFWLFFQTALSGWNIRHNLQKELAFGKDEQQLAREIVDDFRVITTEFNRTKQGNTEWYLSKKAGETFRKDSIPEMMEIKI